MILHGYWRSGASYRTRIALNLKGLAYDQRPVDLRKGEQSAESYRGLSGQTLVPALELDDGQVLVQSPAILEWLEETHPQPPLLPRSPRDRATVRAMCAVIGCDVQPLNNLRVLKAVRALGADEDGVNRWAQGWIEQAFNIFAPMARRHGGDWCFGDNPTLADCYLIPQIYSARRFGVDMSDWTNLTAIEARAADHPAFAAAHPDRQPDADAPVS